MLEAMYPNTLFRQYSQDFQSVRSFYAYEPTDQGLLKRYENMEKLEHRDLLMDLLLQYNKSIEAPSPVLENIHRLGEQGSCVLIGGQQAGFLTGPLYTVYKAISIIAQAERASRLLGCPVLPVFWVASDDHDFQEIKTICLEYQGKLHTLSLEGKYRTRPIGSIRVKEKFLKTLQDFEALVPPTEFRDTYLQMLKDTGRKGESLAQWFARIMVKLFGDWGLIFFDPLQPGTGDLKRMFLQRLYQGEKAMVLGLHEQEQALQEQGYSLQVQKDPSHTHIFLIQNRERRPIFRKGEGYESRGGNLSFSRQEFWSFLENNPHYFSPDALLRPLFQDFIFPVLASVHGPGEIAYQAQLQKAYNGLGMEQPPLLPRQGLTLIEQRFFRYLNSWQISPWDIMEKGEALLPSLLHQKSPVNLEHLFSQTRTSIQSAYDELLYELTALDPQMEKLGRKNLNRILGEVDYLQGKSQERLKEKEATLVRQFSKVCTALIPDSSLQERTYNVFPYLIRYGPGLLQTLKKALEDLKAPHGLLSTDGEWIE